MEITSLPFLSEGTVIHGAGRGSKLLLFPTANIDPDSLTTKVPTSLIGSIYYGFVTFLAIPSRDNNLLPATLSMELKSIVFRMVASLGYNPVFSNTLKPTLEIHIMDTLPEEVRSGFYGSRLRFLFLNRLRSEEKFSSIDALRAAIASDIDTASQRIAALGAAERTDMECALLSGSSDVSGSLLNETALVPAPVDPDTLALRAVQSDVNVRHLELASNRALNHSM